MNGQVACLDAACAFPGLLFRNQQRFHNIFIDFDGRTVSIYVWWIGTYSLLTCIEYVLCTEGRKLSEKKGHAPRNFKSRIIYCNLLGLLLEMPHKLTFACGSRTSLIPRNAHTQKDKTENDAVNERARTSPHFCSFSSQSRTSGGQSTRLFLEIE